MKKKSIFFMLLIVAGLSCGVVFYKWVQLLEKENDFVSFILIRDAGMYTLVGSKPMTIGMLIDYSRVDKNASEEFDWVKVNVKVSFSEIFDKNVIELWPFWKQRHQLSNERYLLIQKKGDFFYFINKATMKSALILHQDFFTKILGESFDVDQVLEHLEDAHSFFWTKLLNNSLIEGVLLGYGLENATKFHEGNFKKDEVTDNFSCSLKEMLTAGMKKDVTLEDLPMPVFRIFSKNDEQVQRYRDEQKRIKEEYKNVNLRKLFIEAFD